MMYDMVDAVITGLAVTGSGIHVDIRSSTLVGVSAPVSETRGSIIHYGDVA